MQLKLRSDAWIKGQDEHTLTLFSNSHHHEITEKALFFFFFKIRKLVSLVILKMPLVCQSVRKIMVVDRPLAKELEEALTPRRKGLLWRLRQLVGKLQVPRHLVWVKIR